MSCIASLTRKVYPAPRQHPLCSFSAPTQPLGIPLPYPNRLPGYAKGMPTLCEGYAKGMPVCFLQLKWVDTAGLHMGFR